jgi:hypothetical protein
MSPNMPIPKIEYQRKSYCVTSKLSMKSAAKTVKLYTKFLTEKGFVFDSNSKPITQDRNTPQPDS